MGFVDSNIQETSTSFGERLTPERHQANQALQPQPEAGNNLREISFAAIEQDNTLASAMGFWRGHQGPPTKEEDEAFVNGLYNPVDTLPEKYKNDPKLVESWYENVTNDREAQWMTGNFERLLNNREVLNNNFGTGMAVSFLVAMTSPEQAPLYAIPAALVMKKTSKLGQIILGISKAGKNKRLAAGQIGRAVGYESLVSGTTAAVGEALLHPTQATRTLEESAYIVGGSVIIGGALAAALGGLTNSLARNLLKEVDADMAKFDSSPVINSKEDFGDNFTGTSAGAMEAEVQIPKLAEAELKDMFEVKLAAGDVKEADRVTYMGQQRKLLQDKLTEVAAGSKRQKVMAFIGHVNPAVRVAFSPSKSVRKAGLQLVNDILTRNAHKYGATTSESVENVLELTRRVGASTLHDVGSSNYKKYAVRIKGEGGKPLTKAQFQEQVGLAMGDLDKHELLEVATAAKEVRMSIAGIEKRLVEQDLIDWDYNGYGTVKRNDLSSFIDDADADKLFHTVDGKEVPVDNIGKLLDDFTKQRLYNTGIVGKKADLPLGDKSYFPQAWDGDVIANKPRDFTNAIEEEIMERNIDMRERKLSDARAKIDADITALSKEVGDEDAAKLINEAEARPHYERSTEIEVRKANIAVAQTELTAARDELFTASRRKAVSEKVITETNEEVKVAAESLATLIAKRPYKPKAKDIRKPSQVANDKAIKSTQSRIRKDKDIIKNFDEKKSKLKIEDIEKRLVNKEAKLKQLIAKREVEKPVVRTPEQEALEVEIKSTRAKLSSAKSKLKRMTESPLSVVKKEQAVFDAGRKLKEAKRTEKISPEQKIKEAELDLNAYRVELDEWINETLPEEIGLIAQEIKKAISGNKLKPSFKIEGSKANPFKDRTFNASSERFKPFLRKNFEEVWNTWQDGVLPSLIMKERTGDANGESILKGIKEEYSEMKLGKTNEEVKKLDKRESADIRDVSAFIESLHDRYKAPDDPNNMFSKVGRFIREINFMSKLGMMTVSAIPDIGHIILRHGIGNTTRALMKWSTMNKGLRLSMGEMKAYGVYADLVMNQRANAIGGLDARYGLSSKYQRGMDLASAKFSQATLMPRWNSSMKLFTAHIYSNSIITDAMKMKGGKLNRNTLTRYARAGLDSDDLSAIAKEIKAQEISEVNGTWTPDTGSWKDQRLAERFKGVILKETDTTIVTPQTGDLPLVSRTELGRIIFQFKSFALAANNRIIVSGLDDPSADKLIGLLSMVFFGGISQMTRNAFQGKETDLSSEEAINRFIDNAIDRSGALAFMPDINAAIEKLVGQGFIPKFAENEMLSRYAARNLSDQLLGVTAGLIEDSVMASRAIATGEVDESSARSIRRLFVLNNMLYFHRIFNKFESAIGGKPTGTLGDEL